MSNEVVKQHNGANIWNKILSTSLKMPYVKVDRESFLRSEFSIYCDETKIKKIISSRPIDCVSENIVDKVALACINSETNTVSVTSFFAGIPGGLALLGTVPADIGQYYCHLLVIAQKLAYIYGFDSLVDENGNIKDSAKDLLTMFIAIMLGANVANAAVAEIAKGLSEQALKRLPKMALTKTWYYPIIKNLGSRISKEVTKQSFAKGVSKIVPILGGFVSGGITYLTFRPQAKRLQRKLKEIMNMSDKEGLRNPIYKEEDYTEFSEE